MNDQLILSIVIIGLLAFFISGKYRYDYVSLGALALLILFDVIKIENAFIGFSHPAVITVALVLLISKGLQDAGLSAVTGNVIGRFFSKRDTVLISNNVHCGHSFFIY